MTATPAEVARRDYAFPSDLPRATTCTVGTCTARVRTIPKAHGKATAKLVVNARSNKGTGTVWVRYTPDGDVVAQELKADAAKGFVAGGVPLFALHAKTCAGKARPRKR